MIYLSIDLSEGGAQEELRAVGARAGVGHREDAAAGVLEGEVLVGELGAWGPWVSPPPLSISAHHALHLSENAGERAP